MRQIILLLALFAFCSNMSGQKENLYFNRLSVEDGLSDNFVLSLAMDSDGLMWFGTYEGLNRYDGRQFKKFLNIPDDPASISSSFINCVYNSPSGKLWVGTEKGLNLYDPEKETFIHPKADNDTLDLLNNKRIRSVYEDRNGIVWVGTLDGLIRLDYKNRYINYFKLVAETDDKWLNEVRCICPDKTGMLWLGTFDGLYKFNPEDNSTVKFEVGQRMPYDPYNNLINCLYIPDDSPDKLYVGSSTGLIIVEIGTHLKVLESVRQENSGLPNNDIQGIVKYDNSRLMLATARGLALYNLENGDVDAYYNSLESKTTIPDNSLRYLYRDKNDIIWLASDSGVAKLDKKRKRIYFTPITDRGLQLKVNDLLVDGNSMWLSTNDGIYRYDTLDTGVRRTHYLETKGVSHPISLRIIKDSRGIVWIATNDGLDYYDKRTDSFRKINLPEELRTTLKYIYDLKEDCDGDIVVNVGSGLCFMRPECDSRGRITGFDAEIAAIDNITGSDNCDIVYIQPSEDGTIWCATNQEGIFRYSKQHGTYINYKVIPGDSNSVSSNKITTIHQDMDGVLWFGTDLGLCRYCPETDSFRRYSEDADLSSSIRSVFSDEKGRLWIVSRNKLIMYDYRDNEKIVCDLAHDFHITELINNSFYASSDHLYVGGKGGFLVFDPDEISIDTRSYPLVFTSLEVGGKTIAPGYRSGKQEIIGKSITHTDKIKLRYADNTIKIYFSLLNYTASNNNRYRYRLEGYEREWNMTDGSNNYASYLKLPPGKYTFVLYASTPDMVWNPSPISIDIRVRPPFWRTWWAYLIYLMIISVTGFSVYNFFRARMRLNAELRLEKLERLKIEKLNQVKMKFFTNVSHEFKTPLSLIIGPAESLVEEIHDEKQVAQLNLIRQNGRILLRLINQIMDLRKMDYGKLEMNLKRGDIVAFIRQVSDSFSYQAQKRNIDFDFESEVSSMDMDFDSDMIEKVMYNLLSNAFKFTPANGHVGVNIQKKISGDSYGILVEVSDTGIGIRPEEAGHIFERFYQGTNEPFESVKGTGIGLMLTKEYIEKHGGNIECETSVGRGTSFRFSLPVSFVASGTHAVSVRDESEDELSLSGGETRLKVLVVEDNADLQSFIKMNLEHEYSIFMADNGDEGYEMVKKCLPDIVICDVMMPGMNGLDVCRHCKKDIITSHIPFIILTAKNDEESRSTGYEAGADAYLSKPFSMKTLQKRIESLIRQRQMLQEKYKRELLVNPNEIEVESENDKFIVSMVRIIEENMDNSEFGIKDLCDNSKYSYQQVYRKIKALTGESINEFIRTVRLKRAAQMLSSGDSETRVSDVMYSVGFSSHSYFTKCFKEKFGLSPKEYAEKSKMN